MPRAQVAGREIRRRSRNGCWNCKARKVKCGEEKPRCSNCERLDEDCDYKIRLSWGGRPLKKKLQQQENPNGTDGDGDETQFIPGAGQFSLTQHFPAPQTFVQSSLGNGARRPAVPRAGSGKKTSMSNYQTVFAVGETTLPSAPQTANQPSPQRQLPPSTPKVKTEPITSPIQTPVPNFSNSIPQRRESHPTPQQNGNGWSHQPPHSAPPRRTSFESAHIQPIHQPHQQQTSNQYYNQYTTAPYSPRQGPTSPMTIFNSPPLGKAHSNSPEMGFQPLGSPQNQQFSKSHYHPPPPIVTSPSKRPRTLSTTSPTQPPPSSPYLPYNDRSLVNKLNDTIHYMDAPITSAPISAIIENTAVTSMGMSPALAMRRVSVDQLLAAPLVGNTAYSGVYNGGYPAEIGTFTPKVEPQYAPQFGPSLHNHVVEDEDVEEIPRNDHGLMPYNSHFPADHIGKMMANGLFPLHISIPRPLAPFPQLLLGNQENMMYFDHYLKHTARLLVSHDCSENPFKHILPQMAVQTDHLMNLLLAYSASHQARLLNHPEPTQRIGEFIDETVKSLAVALNHPQDATSDASLATAIMLASYQIVTPNPFDGLTWRTHLNAARRIVLSRGGAEKMHSNDSVSYFLGRWFAYLDLIGRLSGREIDEPISSGRYWTSDSNDEGEENSVDCFFGFTRRCIMILAHIGELARQCDVARREYDHIRLAQQQQGLIMGQGKGMNGNDGGQWTPPREFIREAMSLRHSLYESRANSVGKCGHDHDHSPTSSRFDDEEDESEENFDQEELLAANDAFHWAAEIHLLRRVLNYQPSHPDIQENVGYIFHSMQKVRQGGTAENCLLFPMFTAGCEAEEHSQNRDYVLNRMMEIEKTGLTQVKNARILMQRVWMERVPWWEIANGEFIG